MERGAWNKFIKARGKFRKAAERIARELPELEKLQQKLANSRGKGKNSLYKVETSVVYNSALDDLKVVDEIKLILVADNPGRAEQAAENRRYLVGPSGKIAQKFFRDNPALGVDFQKNVIILNKTPIHCARTTELRELCKMKAAVSAVLEESQKTMASLLLEFQLIFNAQAWIIGYSEMKNGGLFETYTNELKKLYATRPDMYKQLFIFRHFSMNQFTIDLKQQTLPDESAAQTLKRIGTAYRQRILGS